MRGQPALPVVLLNTLMLYTASLLNILNFS
jgi:hypothetical protein